MTIASNRTFGIELECYLKRGTSHAEMAQKIQAALYAGGFDVGCHADGYNHNTRSYWKIVTDGSLDDYNRGAEVVSPILSGEDGIRQAAIVSKALLDAGTTVNKKCGYHLHVFAGDFTAEHMRKLILNFVWFEDFFDHIMPPSRRGIRDTYCNSNRAAGNYSATRYGTEALNAWFPRLEGVMTRNAIHTEATKIAYLIEAACGRDRYWKMNLRSFDRQKTVEFRQHSGTVDPDKVTRWIRLMVGLVEKSMVSKPRPRTVTRDLTPQEEMSRFFAYVGGFVDPETRAYYVARRAALAGETARRDAVATADRANAEGTVRAMFDALNVRRERAVSRNHVRIAQRCANLAQQCSYALQVTTASRSHYLASAIATVRNSGLVDVPAVQAEPARRARPRLTDTGLLADMAA